MQPKAGLCSFSIKQAVNGLYLAICECQSVGAGDVASRGRSEPEHQLPKMGSAPLWIKRLLFHCRAGRSCTLGCSSGDWKVGESVEGPLQGAGWVVWEMKRWGCSWRGREGLCVGAQLAAAQRRLGTSCSVGFILCGMAGYL